MNNVITVEYVWLDKDSNLRSKIRTIKTFDDEIIEKLGLSTKLIGEWSFDGSSTGQANGNDSDRELKPVCIVKGYSTDYVALCEVFNNGSPDETNTRSILRKTLSTKHYKNHPISKHLVRFGFEQEYTLMYWDSHESKLAPEGFNIKPKPTSQGAYYCAVGNNNIIGRKIAEAHLDQCIKSNLSIYGINSEVMPGQWEYQIGPKENHDVDPVTAADHLWLSRYFLMRIAEDFNVVISFDPKPASGDWNGAGLHTNFSTYESRQEGGLEEIKNIISRLEKTHQKVLESNNYGAGYEERLTGKHETCSWKEFKWGIADRTCSIRIPRSVALNKSGYLEDRRPCANADPYLVEMSILESL